MTEPTRRPHQPHQPQQPHRAYRRLSEQAGRPAAGGPPCHTGDRRPPCHRASPPSIPDACGVCHAPRPCCHCRAEVADLRRFARRMAEIHQPTGTTTCGCGAHNCYVRVRLDDIRRRPTP